MSRTNLLCGPLLRYTWIDHERHIWHGSVLVVLAGPLQSPPSLHLSTSTFRVSLPPVPLLSERGHTFWRFSVAIPLSHLEQKVDYTVSGGPLAEDVRENFWVPGRDDSMRIMFYSCNGFSSDCNPDDFAGVALWQDVVRIHEMRPFHVMIGGGDQVYTDNICTEGPLKEWAEELTPKKRAAMPCTPKLEREMDEWFFNNYCDWYSTPHLRDALARLPSINIWDDHDIIDGYGSYSDRWMRAPIFKAIGRVAWKHYLLFQLQIPPGGEAPEDPSWVFGKVPGPYIQECSRSVCTTLGKRIVFLGLDCRTERTVRRICYRSTYDGVFERLEGEVGRAAETTHLVLLLGVPIAGYPRLVWAEKLLSGRTIVPLQKLNRKFGVADDMFNNFDGSAELLDDLNDHWCAGVHKRERNYFVRRLQDFAAKKQIRVTILSGDVHLAAVGRFFSKAKLKVPQNKDPRYMINVISSAITNAGPPMAVANFLNKRNKEHRLDRNTRENMMDIFFENPDGKPNKINRTTLPYRNYCIITEHAGLTGGGGASEVDELAEGHLSAQDAESQTLAQAAEKPGEDMDPARRATGGPGNASAAAPMSGSKRRFALDVSLRVEIDQRDPSGQTRAYGFAIPALER